MLSKRPPHGFSSSRHRMNTAGFAVGMMMDRSRCRFDDVAQISTTFVIDLIYRERFAKSADKSTPNLSSPFLHHSHFIQSTASRGGNLHWRNTFPDKPDAHHPTPDGLLSETGLQKAARSLAQCQFLSFLRRMQTQHPPSYLSSSGVHADDGISVEICSTFSACWPQCLQSTTVSMSSRPRITHEWDTILISGTFDHRVPGYSFQRHG